MIELGPFSLDRIERAADKVRDRLRRVTEALDAAGVPYAVIGGNPQSSTLTSSPTSRVTTTR